MFAYPARWREEHGEDVFATLAEGDDERGRPSVGEAWALLVHGLLLRVRVQLTSTVQQRVLAGAAMCVLLASGLPARAWAQRLRDTGDGLGMPVVDGPPPAGRALLAAVAIAVIFAVAPRRLQVPLLAAGSCFATEVVIGESVAWSRLPSRGLAPSIGILATSAAAALAVALAVDFARRRPSRQRMLLCATATLAVVVPALVTAMVLSGPGVGASAPLMPWQLGPAGLLTLLAGAVASVALAGATQRRSGADR